MLKILFQDKNGNKPIVAAFVSAFESRSVIAETKLQLEKSGVQILSSNSQSIITINGKYWLV